MASRSPISSAVDRLLSAARCVLEGKTRSISSMDDLLRKPSPEDIIALRLYASDALVAYELSGRQPPVSLLQSIVRAIVAIPNAPRTSRHTDSIDRATSILLKRYGVTGLFCQSRGGGAQAPPLDPMQLLVWATARTPLAAPRVTSHERITLSERRSELFEGVALALMELEPARASAGLRWLSLLGRGGPERRLVMAGIRRASQLGMVDARVLFNCNLAAKLLQTSKT